MTDKTRALLGVGLIIIGLFYNKISDFIVIPEPEPDVTIIEIDKPSQDIINVTKPVADLVINKEDRLKLCIFNKIFAERVVGYLDIKAQHPDQILLFRTLLSKKHKIIFLNVLWKELNSNYLKN